MDEQLMTGRFAELSGLTPRALRLYDERGLLRPAAIDPVTCYRWYDVAQLEVARTIRLLRRIGVPLDDVADVLAGPEPLRHLDRWWWQEEQRMAERRRVHAYLRHRLSKEDTMSFPISVKTVPEQAVLTIRRTVGIAELHEFVTTTLDRLHDALRSSGIQPSGPPVTIYHSPVNDEVDGEVEVGVFVPDGVTVEGYAPSRLPGGEVAWTTSAGDYPGILGAYDAIASWAESAGRPFAGPPRELTLSVDAGPEEGGTSGLLLEVDWPLGPAA